MKRYEFRLETLRRIRRIEEDRAKAELLQANNQVADAGSEVKYRISNYIESLDSKTHLHSIPAARFMAHRYFAELSGLSVIASQRRLARAEEIAESKRDVWSDSAKKVRALDRLDERRREEYRIETARDETKEVDDIVTTRRRQGRPQ